MSLWPSWTLFLLKLCGPEPLAVLANTRPLCDPHETARHKKYFCSLLPLTRGPVLTCSCDMVWWEATVRQELWIEKYIFLHFYSFFWGGPCQSGAIGIVLTFPPYMAPLPTVKSFFSYDCFIWNIPLWPSQIVTNRLLRAIKMIELSLTKRLWDGEGADINIIWQQERVL